MGVAWQAASHRTANAGNRRNISVATRAIGPDPGLPYSYVRWGYDQSLRLVVAMLADRRLKADFFEPARFSYKDIKKVYDQIHQDPTSIGLQALLIWK